MRITTHTLLFVATVSTTLAAGQPLFALTAEEKRENFRIGKAKTVSLDRKSAEVRFAYAEKCEAAFVAGEPMPERDVRVTEEVDIDDDLMGMSVEEISEQLRLASDAFDESDKAVNDCLRKYKKRNEGS